MEKEQRFYFYKLVADRLNTFIKNESGKISLNGLSEIEIIKKLIIDVSEMYNSTSSALETSGSFAAVFIQELKEFRSNLLALKKKYL